MMNIFGLQDLTLKFKNKQWISVLLFTFFIQALVVFEAMAADTTIKGTSTGDTVVALDVTDSSETSLLCVRNDGTVGIGTATPGTKLEVNGAISGFGIAPIGSIIAWHKSFAASTPALPDGWVECNGQTLNDADSVYHDQVIPNLNGDARFLRGSGTSGTEQAATSHFHFGSYSNRLYFPKAMTEVLNTDSRATEVSTVLTAVLGTTTSLTYNLYKARPVNMSVVWIMRVK